MFSFGSFLGLYLLIGFCLGVRFIFKAKKDPEIFNNIDDFGRSILRYRPALFLIVATLFGVLASIYIFFISVLTSTRTKDLPITVRGVEMNVWAEVDKKGIYLTNTIDAGDDSLEFLDDLDQEEFDQWIREICIALNESYKFDREVLYSHLADT